MISQVRCRGRYSIKIDVSLESVSPVLLAAGFGFLLKACTWYTRVLYGSAVRETTYILTTYLALSVQDPTIFFDDNIFFKPLIYQINSNPPFWLGYVGSTLIHLVRATTCKNNSNNNNSRHSTRRNARSAIIDTCCATTESTSS